jgi:hypothetical protein
MQRLFYFFHAVCSGWTLDGIFSNFITFSVKNFGVIFFSSLLYYLPAIFKLHFLIDLFRRKVMRQRQHNQFC